MNVVQKNKKNMSRYVLYSFNIELSHANGNDLKLFD